MGSVRFSFGSFSSIICLYIQYVVGVYGRQLVAGRDALVAFVGVEQWTGEGHGGALVLFLLCDNV